MLKSLFAWFDAHAQSYWVIAALPTLVLLVWTAGLIWRQPKSDRAASKQHEALFVLLVFAVLLAWRWPFLLSADEYNPDESQLIAGALTLRIDPVPWRGVDGFTSGPLNFYPLAGLRLVGLPLDYFTARLVALLMIWGALLACYRLARSWFSLEIARIGILPALAFFSTVTDWDFIHYSSEHLSLFLTALSAGCILQRQSNRSGFVDRRVVGCFVAGMLPLAKLQSGPLAAALVIIALVSAGNQETDPAKSRLRIWGTQLMAAVLPAILLLVIVLSTGQFEHFLRSYLLQNFVYVGNGASLLSTVRDLWSNARMTAHYPWFVAISLLGCGLGALATRRGPRHPLSLWFGTGLVVASVICIVAPRRALLHYVLFSIVPLTIALEISLGRWFEASAPSRRKWLGLLAITVCGVVPFGLRMTQPVPEMFGLFADHWREPRTPLARVLRSYATPHSRLAIWGWLPSLYVESGLPQGTRDGNTSWAMIPSPYRDYYAQRFFSDVQRNQPDLFVDAVGSGARFFSDRSQAGHENFPELATYIQQHYRFVVDVGYARVYARNGLPEPALPETSQERLLISENGPATLNTLERERLTPPDLPQRQLRNGFVQMMHPPAEIVWRLDETTREIVFEYGFAPEAYTRARSDGAELIFELHSDGVPIRHLFYRFLDPVRRAADRGPVTSRLILPPFKPGARLVARTTPGPSGNGAWDWIYLGQVRPIRSPAYSPAQFPHFNRVPDFADADLSYLLEENDENILILHAPAVLTYLLNGQEQRLRFDFGFRSGAYSNGGQTDGATFQVALQGVNGSHQILFEKELTPTSRPEDRGFHPADFSIPSGNAGAKLVIRVDPGKGNAWDWTSITNFVLQ